MKSINEYAKKWNRDSDNCFAAACYNDNSVEELKYAQNLDVADPADCRTWNISADEWNDAINAALNEKLEDN